jgi:ATP/maltotriose-dependent transcriptional regulator MalT
MLGLGEAWLLASREEAAAEAYRAAATWHASQNDLSGHARARRGLGLALWRQDALAEAQAELAQAIRLMDRLPRPDPEAVRTRVDLAALLGNVLAESAPALGHVEVALHDARALGDPRLEAAASRMMGFLLVLANRIPAGIPLLERALDLATVNGDMAEAAECGSALSQAYVWSGQIQRATAVSRQREEHARRAQQPYRLHYVYSWLAFLEAAHGSWEAAEANLEMAHASLVGAASARPSAFLHQIRGYLAYQRADFRLAADQFRVALEVFEHKDPLEHQLCFGMLGLTYLEQGDHIAARSSLSEQEILLQRLQPGSLPHASAASTLLLLAAGLGDTGRVAALLPGLQACTGQHHWFLVDRVLATGETILGNWRIADAHLETAESIARSEGLLPELARVLRARAALISAHGGQGAGRAARALCAEAAELSHSLRLDGHAAARAQTGLMPRPPANGRPSAADLTPRETEVLQLVAMGLSSRCIAKDLSLSQHTVAKHLTSIFAKLGVDNRAAAAAFAIRNGLA